MTKKNDAFVLRDGPRLISETAPFEYIEAYKSLRTNISFITANNKYRKIVVTSALRDEGKSSMSVNLAISLTQTGSKVLLIDADMRNPSLRRYLHMKKDDKHGLSNLLTGNVKVGDCLVKTKYGFDLVAGGAIPPNPAELISSDSMQALLDSAAMHYDYIICDAPPIGIITDAAALSPLCDGILYVVRHGFANKNQVRDAIRKLEAVNAKIIGAVMTQYMIPKDSISKYRYRNYGYKYEYGYGYGASKDDE